MKSKYLGVKNVEWVDAREITLEADEFDRMIESDGYSYLIIKNTFGLVYRLKDITVVVMETSNDGTRECTIVPNKWIIGIT